MKKRRKIHLLDGWGSTENDASRVVRKFLLYYRYGFTFCLCLFAVFPSHAQSLDEYLEIAAENSPQLQSSFKAYEASLQKVNQVSLESPELSVGVFTKPMELLMGNQRADVSLMQMFPWFGMLKTQKDEMTLMAEANYEEFRQQRNLVLFQVKEAYFQLTQLQHTVDVTEANLEIMKMLERLAITRYQGGNVSAAASSVSSVIRRPVTNTSRSSSSSNMGMDMGEVDTQSSDSPSRSMDMQGMSGMGTGSGSGRLTDVLRLQVQIKGLESDLEQLEVDKRPLLAKFNRLLGRDRLEPMEIDAVIGTERDKGWELAFLDSILASNPMLLMLEKESQVYRKQGEMARLEGKPMFGAGLNYMVFSARPESGMPGGGAHGMEYMPAGMGKNMVMPMVTMTLPLYRKKYKSMDNESRIWGEAIERKKEDLKGELSAEFESQLASVRDSERKIRLLTEQIELTEKTLELAVTAYATEGTSFEEILTIQRELLDFRLQKLNTAVDREVSFARLESMVGY